MISENFWKGKKVFITGHTGFKGSWLSLWLLESGAHVIGYSLNPPTEPNLFTAIRIKEQMTSINGDIRDREKLIKALKKHNPQIVFHLAAQPIVTESYSNPAETFEVNVMGTVNLLDAVRYSNTARVVINVTSDKCYENREWLWNYRENDPMGGYDPYSCSKGCSELITSSFRRSYYNNKGIMLASARAGNVIGGGDWAKDRLVPDIIKALNADQAPQIRNPYAIRPWQHVLEPLCGYMLLAEKLWKEKELARGWNFGPEEDHIVNVLELTGQLAKKWSNNAGKEMIYECENTDNPCHEAQILKLDSSEAKFKLGWQSKLDINKTLDWTVDWYRAFYQHEEMKEISLKQIKEYEALR